MAATGVVVSGGVHDPVSVSRLVGLVTAAAAPPSSLAGRGPEDVDHLRSRTARATDQVKEAALRATRSGGSASRGPGPSPTRTPRDIARALLGEFGFS